MALFQHRGKNGQRFVVIFDVGSGSIGGAFVGITPGKPPEIIFTTRRDIPFQEKLNFRRFLDSMATTMEEMFTVLQKEGGGVRVDHAYCVLASPWYASQTRLIRYNQATPFVVTKNGLNELIKKEIGVFRDSKVFTHAKTGDGLPEIMESKNIQIKLNGYTVKDPFGKKVSELEVAVYISMIPANVRALIAKSIGKFWRLSSVDFFSFSLTAFDTIRDVFPHDFSFLFMDISGEVTDISLVRDGVLLESVSFPMGKNALIRGLVQKMKTTPGAAISELELFGKHHSAPEHTKQIGEVLRETTKEWRAFFEEALSRFAVEFPIPRAIFYTADDNMSEWFGGAIRETGLKWFSQEDEGSFNIRLLSNVFLSKFVHTALPDFQDPFLSIEAIFANKLSSLT